MFSVEFSELTSVLCQPFPHNYLFVWPGYDISELEGDPGTMGHALVDV